MLAVDESWLCPHLYWPAFDELCMFWKSEGVTVGSEGLRLKDGEDGF